MTHHIELFRHAGGGLGLLVFVTILACVFIIADSRGNK